MAKDLPATNISFEQFYSDGSGVEYAVRYDREANEIEIESADKITFPAKQLNWLMAALMRVSVESAIKPPKKVTE